LAHASQTKARALIAVDAWKRFTRSVVRERKVHATLERQEL